jgi:hypothetical protein
MTATRPSISRTRPARSLNRAQTHALDDDISRMIMQLEIEETALKNRRINVG